MNTSRTREARSTRVLTPTAATALTLVAAALVVSAPASRAFADGDSRPATEQEKKFHSLVMGVLQKAIPPGPKGWREERDAV